MLDPGSVTKQVDEKEKSEEELYKRHDADYGIWNLKPTEVDAHTGIVNITSPDPRSFADELQKGLVRALRTIQIRMGEQEGSDERDNISKLERLFDFCFERADLYLRNIGLPPLKNQLVWFEMIRGFGGIRVLNYLDKNKELVANYLPLDRRWLTYEYRDDGLAWVSYKTYRSKADLKATYNYDAKGKSTPLRDHWGWEDKRVVELVICEKKLLKKQVYPKLRRLPFVIVPVATRPPIVDSAGYRIAGYGDSIFAASRDLVPARNKMMTLWATWANLLANLPQVHKKAKIDSKDIDTLITYPGAIIDLPPDDSLESVKVPEISNTLIALMGELSAEHQRATAPYVVFGDVAMPSSGTAISELKEAEEKAYSLCLDNLNSVYTDMCYMIEEQIVDGGLKFEITGEDKERKFYKSKIAPVDIKRPHIIKVEHLIRSKFGELQAYEVAQMAKMLGLPEEYVYETILKVQDPKRLRELAKLEVVEKDPVLLLRAVAYRLKEEGRDEELGRVVELINMLGEREEVVATPTRTPTAPTGAMPATPAMPAPIGAGAITPGGMI